MRGVQNRVGFVLPAAVAGRWDRPKAGISVGLCRDLSVELGWGCSRRGARGEGQKVCGREGGDNWPQMNADERESGGRSEQKSRSGSASCWGHVSAGRERIGGGRLSDSP